MGYHPAIPKCFTGMLYLPTIPICHTPSSLSFQLYAHYSVTLIGFCLLYTCWPVFILKVADWRSYSLPLEWKIVSFMAVVSFPALMRLGVNPQKAQSPTSVLQRSAMPGLGTPCHCWPFGSTYLLFSESFWRRAVSVTAMHASPSFTTRGGECRPLAARPLAAGRLRAKGNDGAELCAAEQHPLGEQPPEDAAVHKRTVLLLPGPSVSPN